MSLNQTIRLLALCLTLCLIVFGGCCLWYSPVTNPSVTNAERYPAHYTEKYGSEFVKKARVLLGDRIADRYAAIVRAESLTASDFQFLGLPSPSDEFIGTADGAKLHGWLFQAPGAESLVLYHSLWPMWRTITSGIPRSLIDNHVSVFIYDYRGSGQSTGNPTLEKLNL